MIPTGNNIPASDGSALTENNGGNDDGDDDVAELKSTLNTFKSMTGLWDIDPPDSA